MSAVREGMARVVPVRLLSLFTGPELETMVCGSPDIPLDLLKSVVTYKGVEATAPLVRWFWETLESFSNAERSLFLRFVWGRTRLPRTIVDFRGRDFVFQVSYLPYVKCGIAKNIEELEPFCPDLARLHENKVFITSKKTFTLHQKLLFNNFPKKGVITRRDLIYDQASIGIGLNQ